MPKSVDSSKEPDKSRVKKGTAESDTDIFDEILGGKQRREAQRRKRRRRNQ